MTRGTVTGGWAWKHHRRWLREQLREEVPGEQAPLRGAAE
jgi:formate dehydrogenase subunit gamma